MNKDYYLLQETLETFQKIRAWITPDFYRDQVLPTVNKIKERVAIIETEKFMSSKASEPDTIPSQLDEVITNFGLFNESKKDI